MSNLKVLPLDTWLKWLPYDLMTNEVEECLARYRQIPPILSRSGRYLHRIHNQNLPWFELPDGRAFSEDRRGDFEYQLHLFDVERLNARQIAALSSVVAQRLATKEQRRLLWLCRCAQEHRRAGRSARAYSIKMRKELLC